MSIKLMSEVWSLDIDRNKQLVLMALADHANDQGYCFPSNDYLAWKTNYDPRQIQRILDNLESDKIIIVAKDSTPTTPKTFWLALANAPHKKPYERKPSGRGDIHGTRGDILEDRDDMAIAPKPSNEPPSRTINARAPEKEEFHPRTIILADEDIKNGAFHCACGKNHTIGDLEKDGSAPCGEAIIKLSDPKQKKSPIWQIAMALADVCNLDLDMNGGKTFRFASELLKKARIKPTVSLIKKHYGTGGWWYTDHWRGERYSARPTLHGIRETWGQWDQKQVKHGFIENIQAGFDRYEEIKRGNRSDNQENPSGLLGEIPESAPRSESAGTNHSGMG